MNKSSAFGVLGHADFRRFLAARFLSWFAMFMVSVAVGWQVYDLAHDPFALGMVGLSQFLPAFLLTLPGGLASDRFDRRRVLLAGCGVELLVAALLLTLALSHAGRVGYIYAVVVFIGIGRAILAPASQSLVPFLVPQEDFVRAVAWSSSVFQCAMIAGPAMGGLLYAFGPAYVYATAVGCLLLAAVMILRLKIKLKVHNAGQSGLQGIFNGVKFVFARKTILGAVSLDLFAVLFGGATALLPIFAGEILHVGPWGLGLLRSAPAVGAGTMALWIAHHPVREKAGRKMFLGVALFGVFTILFGLSRWFPLSLLALVGIGAADTISVVVRQTLVQMETPDEMRGRVSAVNMLFVGASNELGEFESGITASWFGTVPAVVVGGLGTLAVVGAWMCLFPKLRSLDRLGGK